MITLTLLFGAETDVHKRIREIDAVMRADPAEAMRRRRMATEDRQKMEERLAFEAHQAAASRDLEAEEATARGRLYENFIGTAKGIQAEKLRPYIEEYKRSMPHKIVVDRVDGPLSWYISPEFDAIDLDELSKRKAYDSPYSIIDNFYAGIFENANGKPNSFFLEADFTGTGSSARAGGTAILQIYDVDEEAGYFRAHPVFLKLPDDEGIARWNHRFRDSVIQTGTNLRVSGNEIFVNHKNFILIPTGFKYLELMHLSPEEIEKLLSNVNDWAHPGEYNPDAIYLATMMQHFTKEQKARVLRAAPYFLSRQVEEFLATMPSFDPPPV